jgi:hypothetical protein
VNENNFTVERNRLIAIIAAVAILTSGLTFGLIKVSGGLAAKAGNAITVTGSASTSASSPDRSRCSKMRRTELVTPFTEGKKDSVMIAILMHKV